MINYIQSALFALLAGVVLVPQAVAEDLNGSAPRDWRGLAIMDIEAAYDAFKREHPGYHDPLNPDFRAHLEEGRLRALSLAGQMENGEEYAAVLDAFSSAFRDGHAIVYPSGAYFREVPAGLRWPGFIANWRGSEMVVTRSALDDMDLVGAKVLSCDGFTVPDLLLRNVFSLRHRPNEPGQWWHRSHRLFLASSHDGLHLIGSSPPEKCQFHMPNGRQIHIELAWVEVPEEVRKSWYFKSTVGETTAIGLSEARPGIFLIGLPDFSPGPLGQEAYQILLADLAERGDDLSAARAIVIDMRGNNGGSSHWSRRVAEAIWGEGFVTAVMNEYHANVRILWRASPAVRAEIQAYSDTPDIPESFKRTLSDILDAFDANSDAQPLVLQPDLIGHDDKPDIPPPMRLDVPVYVITDGGCASACNDALDVFTRFPNTRLIGAPSSADSTYLEVRTQPTPSGMGNIVLPMKIWVGRPPRPGPADTYIPDTEVTGLSWTTETFLDLIEADIAASRPKVSP